DRRQGRHLLDAAEELLEAILLTGEAEGLLLREHVEGAVGRHAVELAEAVDADLHGAEVRERAAEPAARDEELPGAGGLLDDDLLGLALGADEEDVATAGDGVADEVE